MNFNFVNLIATLAFHYNLSSQLRHRDIENTNVGVAWFLVSWQDSKQDEHGELRSLCHTYLVSLTLSASVDPRDIIEIKLWLVNNQLQHKKYENKLNTRFNCGLWVHIKLFHHLMNWKGGSIQDLFWNELFPNFGHSTSWRIIYWHVYKVQVSLSGELEKWTFILFLLISEINYLFCSLQLGYI